MVPLTSESYCIIFGTSRALLTFWGSSSLISSSLILSWPSFSSSIGISQSWSFSVISFSVSSFSLPSQSSSSSSNKITQIKYSFTIFKKNNSNQQLVSTIKPDCLNYTAILIVFNCFAYKHLKTSFVQ